MVRRVVVVATVAGIVVVVFAIAIGAFATIARTGIRASIAIAIAIAVAIAVAVAVAIAIAIAIAIAVAVAVAIAIAVAIAVAVAVAVAIAVAIAVAVAIATVMAFGVAVGMRRQIVDDRHTERTASHVKNYCNKRQKFCQHCGSLPIKLDQNQSRPFQPDECVIVTAPHERAFYTRLHRSICAKFVIIL
jgi:hypothetical protein